MDGDGILDSIEHCLLCYTKCDDWIILNSKHGIDLQIKEIISKHLVWFKFPNTDLSSKAVCAVCWWNIKSFHEFNKRIEKVHMSNDSMLTPNIFHDENNIEDNDGKIFIIESTKSAAEHTVPLPIKLEPLSITAEKNYEGDDDEFPNVNGKALAEISDESVSDYQNDENSDNTGDVDDDNDSDDYKPPKKRPQRKKKVTSSNITSKSATKRKKRIKPAKKIAYVEENNKIRQFCRMACELCDETFAEFSDSKRHYRVEHDQNGYVTCCGKKFFKLSRALQHYEWHQNPEAFKCESCHKCFTDKVSLKEHSDIHAPLEQRTFKCDICPKSYSKRFMLTSHKKLQHAKEEDKKFECNECGQKFIVMGFLRGHIRRVHENSDSRICDICAKFFKCSKAYDHHYLVQHTNTQHKVQCELCGTWLKHQLSLKDHMNRHNALILETCELCGKTCPNKKALRSHITTVHQFIEYPCTICEKPFKKKQTLKEHMAQHTGEKDLYKCLYCTKTFRSSANMYAHRKRAHPKEYEENRLLGKKYSN